MKNTNGRANPDLKTKRLLQILKERISTILGIVILIAVITTGMLFWTASLSRQLSIITHSLTDMTIQTREKQSLQQKIISEQGQRLKILEDLQEEDAANNEITWQVYNNEHYSFSIQYPSNWTCVTPIFNPETIIEFASKTRNDNNGLIHFTITPYDDFKEASKESLIINEGVRIIDSEEVLINDSQGLKVSYKTSESDIFTHYFFMMDKKVIEISLNSADQGYNKTFEDMVMTLIIK